jgi:hypothetical protein
MRVVRYLVVLTVAPHAQRVTHAVHAAQRLRSARISRDGRWRAQGHLLPHEFPVAFTSCLAEMLLWVPQDVQNSPFPPRRMAYFAPEVRS